MNKICKALISLPCLFTVMPRESEVTQKKKSNKFVRSLLFIAGTITLILGAIGIVLPILPTTPFLLLSLACYLRSSERMTHWMLNNKYFGKYIKNYKEGKGIPLKTKIFAIIVLWVTIGYAIYIVPIWIAQLSMFIIAVAVTTHLIRVPTYRG